MEPGAPHTVAVGSRIGPYEILGLLGAGGMGRVYRARDPRLGREVAIKVLPDPFARDADRLARFEREARLLAALNHPHIAAIYGLEETDGLRALVLELVPGSTLAAAMAGGLPIPRALTLACQIADALEAAHAQGIIHRDLKPANIQLAPGDVVKVLDFGVAKTWTAEGGIPASEASTIASGATRDGEIVGTVTYMSPEQARGLRVDQRTDVWAFGCVLFEMLSGHRAFDGATLTDTLAAILDREPDWKALPRSTPARLRTVLRQCFEKDASARAGNMGEIRRQLEDCLAAARYHWLTRTSIPSPLLRSGGIVVVAALAAVAGYRVLRDRPSPALRLINPTQVTSAIGVEDYPSLSPDARQVAYESNQGGNWDIWVSDVNGAASVNRTADNPDDDRYPSWSPDGSHIAFWSRRNGHVAFYFMPSVGGTPERMTDELSGLNINHSAAVWSPDGKQLAYAVYKPSGSRREVTLKVITLATRESRSITLPGAQEGRLDLTWSHDGGALAYLDIAQQPAETSRLMVLNLRDGTARALTDDSLNIRSPRWARDDRSIFFVCNQASTWDLWRQDLGRDLQPQGAKQRVTNGLDVLHADFSADGRRLVYAKGRWVANVWRVPIDGRITATWADAQQMTFDQAFIEFAQVSPDRQWLAFSSDRLGNQDLWKKRIGGDALVRLTSDAALEWAPYWSPDGRQISFYSNRSGNREIWIMPSDGGAGRRLTDTRTSLNAGGAWSPDGTEVAYRSERLGSSDLWVTSADGKRSRVLAPGPSAEYGAGWSPDGKWIAFTSDRGGPRRIWKVAAAGGEPELVGSESAVSPIWSQDGREIYYAVVEGPHTGRFCAVSVATRRERCVANLTGRRGQLSGQPPSTDGRYLYFTWRDDLGDIWIMDVR